MARELDSLTCVFRYTGLNWVPSLFRLTVAAGNCCSYYLLNTAWPTRGADFFYKDSARRRSRRVRDECRARIRYEPDTMSKRAKNLLRKSFTSFSTLLGCILYKIWVGTRWVTTARSLSMKYFDTFARLSYGAMLMLSYEKCQANRTKPCKTSKNKKKTLPKLQES